jgi:hypothetical protein
MTLVPTCVMREILTETTPLSWADGKSHRQMGVAGTTMS